MIERLLPAAVAWAESFGDEDCALFPEEEAVVERAVEKRRREFVTGRWCARRVLEDLGFPATPIVPDQRGAPSWPAGVVGAITHCAGYRAAAAARDTAVRAIGIDAEPHAPLPDGVLGVVSLAAEREWIAEQSRSRPDVCWDRVLFSAKESVYKAWYPLARRWLGFDDAALCVEVTRGGAGLFHAELLVPGPRLAGGATLSRFTGRWLIAGETVVTAIALPCGEDALIGDATAPPPWRPPRS